MIELYILLYVTCGVWIWARHIWGSRVLTVADLVHLPGFIGGWPVIVLIVLVMVAASKQDHILWRRKR